MNRPAVHASCVVVGTRGLLIRGAAGSGKTLLCDALLEAARQKGHFGCLVADDRVVLSGQADRLIARVPATIAGKMEVRGHGIVDVPHLPEARIDLVVALVPEDSVERLPEAPVRNEVLEGVRLPVICCPANHPGIGLRLIRWALRSNNPAVPDYI